jgi:hypothetical protein
LALYSQGNFSVIPDLFQEGALELAYHRGVAARTLKERRSP